MAVTRAKAKLVIIWDMVSLSRDYAPFVNCLFRNSRAPIYLSTVGLIRAFKNIYCKFFDILD